MRSRTWSRLRATLAVSLLAAVLSLGFAATPAQAYPLKPAPVHYQHGAHAGDPGAAAPAPSSGVLPNTGGPAFWILVAGVLLVVAGGAVTAKGRKDRKRHLAPAYPPIG